jgi:7,8-dihydropterin-6-yl-methyl-4-(beta-D-ribofuranosyl)aminobenzene 5'-phosphate synthase
MRYRKSLTIIVSVIIVLFVCIVGFLVVKTLQVKKGKELSLVEIANARYNKMSFDGAVKKLSILPLIDFYTVDHGLKTEAGVSYLIKTDDTVILFDVGSNSVKENPSPLIYNMQKLGIDIRNIDIIFISHLHLDHIGGMDDQRAVTFSLTQGKTDIKNITAYTPKGLAASRWNQNIAVRQIKTPLLIRPGIASIGTIPRFLSIIGIVHEQPH